MTDLDVELLTFMLVAELASTLGEHSMLVLEYEPQTRKGLVRLCWSRHCDFCVRMGTTT